MQKFVTPKGRAVYPALTKPDTRYNAEGVFKTGLSLSPENAKQLEEMCKEVFIEEFGAKKLAQASLPLKINEETGEVTFNFKSKNAPKLFDAKGNPVKNAADLNIGGGSVIKVSGAAKAYNAGGRLGVTLYLNQVQIIDLVEYNGSAFGAEEGGFVAEETASAGGDEVSDF